MYLYLPSCNFTAARPQASKKIQAYLSQKEGVKVMGCCRPAQTTFTESDIVLTICLTCSAITGEVSPKVREMSFWEYVLQDSDFPWPDYHQETMAIQDCWRARNKPALLDSVRECMRRMNLVPVELSENREHTQYDGVWRFHPVIKRNMDIAPKYFSEVEANGLTLIPKEEQKRCMEEWVKQYTTKRTAVYCTACLKGIELGGGNGIHLMELLTGQM